MPTAVFSGKQKNVDISYFRRHQKELYEKRFGTHGVIGGLNATEGGSFLHHEAEQTREDGGDGPGGVPRVWMEVCDGQTQPVEGAHAHTHNRASVCFIILKDNFNSYLVLHLNLPFGVIM